MLNAVSVKAKDSPCASPKAPRSKRPPPSMGPRTEADSAHARTGARAQLVSSARMGQGRSSAHKKGRSMFVGIDVSKDVLDVAVRAQEQSSFRVSRDEKGLEDLVRQLTAADMEIQLVVLEATGGLERDVVAALAAAGIRVAVVNPRCVRD